MADITTVVNDWDTNYASATAINAGTQFNASYGNCSSSGGVARVDCRNGFLDGIQTSDVYSWNGTGFYFKPLAAPKGGSATDMHTYMAIVDGSSTDHSIRLQFEVDTSPATPTISCVLYNTDNTYNDTGTIVTQNYDGTGIHQWLGWYYDASQVYWMRSADGNSWTQMRAGTRPSWITTQTDMGFEYTTNRSATGTTTQAQLNNVNINGTPPGTVAAQNRRGGMFFGG